MIRNVILYITWSSKFKVKTFHLYSMFSSYKWLFYRWCQCLIMTPFKVKKERRKEGRKKNGRKFNTQSNHRWFQWKNQTSHCFVADCDWQGALPSQSEGTIHGTSLPFINVDGSAYTGVFILWTSYMLPICLLFCIQIVPQQKDE